MPPVSRRRATLATVVGSVANTLVVSLQAAVLIPLYVRLIGPQLYGAWLSSGDVLVWLQALDLGLPNLLIQRIGAAHGRSDVRSVAEYAATGIAVLSCIAIVLTLGGCALAYALPGLLHVRNGSAAILTRSIQLGVLGTGIIVFNNSIVGFARAIQRTAMVNTIVVLAAIVGFIVSLVAVLHGVGLIAIPLGIVTRAVVSSIGNCAFMMTELSPQLRRHFRIRRPILHEMIRISPATALAGVGYALMNQSEAAIAGITLGPGPVLILTMSKKAAEVGRSVLDVISYSSYGGFAHLVSSEQRRSARSVFEQIVSLRWMAAVSIAAAYMAVNPSLVSRWVGSQYYGGWLLTVVFATQLIVIGHAYLVNMLFRACGPVLKGSIALIIECVVRVPLMIVFLRWLGLVGLPLAGVFTSAIATLIARRWITRLMGSFSNPVSAMPIRVVVARAAAFGLGAAIGARVVHPTWPFAVSTGIAIALIVAMLQTVADSRVRHALGLSRALWRA